MSSGRSLAVLVLNYAHDRNGGTYASLGAEVVLLINRVDLFRIVTSAGFLVTSLISTVLMFKDRNHFSAQRRILLVSLGVAMVLLGLAQLVIALRTRDSAP
jgi:predicted phage tail protein